jgi:hypothetical protein
VRYDPLTRNKSSDSWKPLPPPRLASALGYPRRVRLGSLRRTGSVTLVEFEHQLHTAYYAPGLLTRDATVFHIFGTGVSYCHVKHLYLTVVACYTSIISWLEYRLLLLYAARLSVEHCPDDGSILQCLACDVRSDGVSDRNRFVKRPSLTFCTGRSSLDTTPES